MTIQDVRALLADDTISDRGVLAAILDLLETRDQAKPERSARREIVSAAPKAEDPQAG